MCLFYWLMLPMHLELIDLICVVSYIALLLLCFNSNYCLKCLLRGFTKFSRSDYLKFKSENRIVPDGVNAKVI